MLSFEPKQMVAEGYDKVAERYLEWSGTDPVRWRLLERLASMLPPRAKVLDVGCGSGIPVAQELTRLGHELVGVDIAARQVAFARRNVPAAKFIHGDVMSVELSGASFDAVTAFFAITHLPRAEHSPFLSRVFAWLRPGGVLLASFGTKATDTVENDWLGVPMFFSHFDAATNVRLVRQAGFTVLSDEILDHDEAGTTVRFLWITARRPS